MRTSLGILILAAACCGALSSQALAAPPEGKGKPAQAGGQGNGKGNNDKGGKGNGQGNGSSKSKGGDHAGHRGGDGDVNVGISLTTAGISVSTARGYAVDYGATGYSSLPPGIRKNLARGKPLPPGIAKKMVPGPMLAHLPVHPGYEWRVAGTDLILVAIGTAIVADVLFDVFD
ncbi:MULTISPECIES: anti-virulence regulator CigR family protein [Bordetella]|uniref:Anti-virulence regulator CigR family protein n=1 Tax=Bordetella petrii TaxID=94624 RepID=A0ABT7W3J4_9BORD|nr:MULTISPECIES: anti-virulence regulator CigR family protein [Bordetella]MDM9559748.1 anti-virulence regulator CigR family protein [Bordetella petrii]